MVGRTNAWLHAVVSSVNGYVGAVNLDAGDIPYVRDDDYGEESVGYALNELENIMEAAEYSGFNYKGSVATASALPASATLGDMYTVTDEGNEKYVWNGSSWIKLNSNYITNAQIDALF